MTRCTDDPMTRLRTRPKCRIVVSGLYELRSWRSDPANCHLLILLVNISHRISFGNGSLMRVFACIDAPGNNLTTTREVSPSVHLHRPVPAPAPASRGCRGSAAKVLPLPLLLAFGFAFDSANYYLPIAICYFRSATKTPSATIPLPVNFLAVR